MPPFVPPEQSEAAQRAAEHRRVATLLADPERGGERPVGGVESLEQRREVALAEIDLGQPRRASFACQVRDQRVDDLLLTGAETQRLAHPLLLEQQIHRQVGLVAGQAAGPLEHLIQRRQRIGELAERDGALRRATTETDRGRPVFGAPEMMREQRRPFVHAIRVRGRERAPDRPVERLPLVPDEAVVADLLGQRVRESIADRRSNRGLLDEPRRFQRVDRRPQVHVRRHHLAEERVIELPPDDRSDPHDLERLRIQVVEPRAYHTLNGIGQHQRALAALDQRVAVAHRHRLLLEQRRAHLLEEERIAPGAVVQPPRQRIGYLPNAEHRLHDGDRGREIQSPQTNARRVCGPMVLRALLHRDW